MRVCVELLMCAQVLCASYEARRESNYRNGGLMEKWRTTYRNGELLGFDLTVLCLAFRGYFEILTSE